MNRRTARATAIATLLLAAGLALGGAPPAGAEVACGTPRRVTEVVPSGLRSQGDVHTTADAEQVVLLSNRDPLGTNADGGQEVYLYDRVLDRITQVTDMGADASIVNDSLDVDADGSSIVLATDEDLAGTGNGNRELFLFTTDATPGTFVVHQLTDTSGGFSDVNASIDDAGDTIAFSSDRNLDAANPDGNHELYVAQLDADENPTFEQVGATTGGSVTNARKLDLSGDGNVVAYLSTFNRTGDNLDGNAEVLRTIVATETTTAITITTDAAGTNDEPSTDLHGNRVLFASSAPLLGPGTNEDERDELYVRDLLAGQTLRITDSGRRAERPEISGDGEVVVFERDGIERVVVDTLDLTAVSPEGGQPDLDDDGSRLVFELDQIPGLGAQHEQMAVACGTPTFLDVGLDHAFAFEIEWMAEEGISEGFPPGPVYRPSSPVSRQAMSAFMYRLAGEPAFADPSTPTFVDVPKNHPFSFEIEWMAATGISEGFQPGPTYRPAVAVSRAAMSAFMFRLAGATASDPATATFTDVSPSHQFFTEIEWMAAEGITTGFQPGPTYRPSSPVSRQAMSAFMQRLGERVPFVPPVPNG